MAFTLGFHIILASLGIAFPAMMLIANYRGLRRDDPVALELAQRWSKVAAVTFAVGAVTGTVLSFEFGLLWPAFTGRFGEVFGVLFAIEGIFFFLEAIFIAIYIFGWKYLSPWMHFWSGVPVVISDRVNRKVWLIILQTLACALGAGLAVDKLRHSQLAGILTIAVAQQREQFHGRTGVTLR